MKPSLRFGLVGGDSTYLFRFRTRLLEHIRARGHEVFAFAGPATEQVRPGLAERSIPLVEFPLERRGLAPHRELPTLTALARALKEARLDAVLSYTPKMVAYGTLAATWAGVPRRYAMMSGLGTAFTQGGRPLVTFTAGALLRSAFELTDLVIFHNPDDRQTLRDLHVLPRRRRTAVVNGSGIDTHEFPQLPIPDGPPSFLMIGRLQREKGVAELLEAAELLQGEARIRLVGPLEAGSEVIARRLRDAVDRGLVEWPGKVDDVRLELARGSVYVLPSYREGTPRSVLEAMASGRAVITTDAPGCRETVVHGDNGFLVPVGDATALAAAMRRFMADPRLCKRMGERSRAMAEAKYEVRKVNVSMADAMGL